MAVVNRTPDSFFDSGRTFGLDEAVAAGLDAAATGADWVDVGGVPFSADVPAVSVAEECDRVMPVIAALTEASDVVVSVDTSRLEVATAAVAAGARVINDTSGLRDPGLAELAAASGSTLVITHSLSGPGVHTAPPTYPDVVAEVTRFLASELEVAIAHGLPEDQIVLDPGHDLNKNTLHSLELTRRLDEVAALGLPVLAAVSNKDFVGETLDLPTDERLVGSVAAAVCCALGGARILRMHDVRAGVQAARLTEAVLGLRPPARMLHNAR